MDDDIYSNARTLANEFRTDSAEKQRYAEILESLTDRLEDTEAQRDDIKKELDDLKRAFEQQNEKMKRIEINLKKEKEHSNALEKCLIKQANWNKTMKKNWNRMQQSYKEMDRFIFLYPQMIPRAMTISWMM